MQQQVPSSKNLHIQSKHLKAFTLVELAIVIVIIGLLVGGVLQGQELIQQTKIRGAISKIQGYNAAANTFRSKYNAIPGDITNPANFGLNAPKGSTTLNVCSAIGDAVTTTSGGGGNGDGFLNNLFMATCQTTSGGSPSFYGTTGFGSGGYRGEIANFFVHLSNGQFVKEAFFQPASTADVSTSGSQFPTMPVGAGMIILTDGNQYWVLGTPKAQTSAQIASLFGNTLSPSEAYSIDSKLDDGNPSTGVINAVTGLNGTNNFIIDSTGGAATCVFTGGTTYNIAGTYADTKLCTLRVRADF